MTKQGATREGWWNAFIPHPAHFYSCPVLEQVGVKLGGRFNFEQNITKSITQFFLEGIFVALIKLIIQLRTPQNNYLLVMGETKYFKESSTKSTCRLEYLSICTHFKLSLKKYKSTKIV